MVGSCLNCILHTLHRGSRWNCWDVYSGINKKSIGKMDWKETLISNSFVGTITLIGAWLVRKYRPALKEAKRMFSVTEDVAGLKKKYESLNATVDAIVSMYPDAVFMCKENGDLIYANDMMCDLFGAKMEDLEGEGWLRFIVNKDREYVTKAYQSAIKNGKHFAPSFTIRNADSEQFISCDCTIILRRDIAGSIINIFGRILKV